MQRIVDNALAVTKESVKTVTYESLNNIARCINGVSALLLTLLPGKANILEGLHGWELRPTFRGPRLPRWMHNGVSSFNEFIHELSVDSDTSSLEYSSGEDSDGPLPPSPSSQSSRLSWASTSASSENHWTEWITFILWWLMFPVRILLWIPQYIISLFYKRSSRIPASPRRHQHSSRPRISKTNSSKDHDVPNRTTDRRRGVIEDLHLAIEIGIEAIFDFFHKATHLLLSPSEAFAILLSWFSSSSRSPKENHGEVAYDETVQTATLGDTDPSPTERPVESPTRLYNSMNTDTRTCQDVITELGYPYEAIRVITSDGYVLVLERIPRRDARKAVFLQHGVLDSSMGWVSNGVVGSPAFAAYDQGYDVFLGNFRGLVSRDHVNKNISSKEFWRYSINEHGTEDIPAMIEKIHEIKTTELKLCQPNIDEEINQEEPYKLCAICHSLGGAAILMYVITRKIKEKPHRLSRLILLSPAGFHEDSNLGFTIVEYIFLFISPVLARIVPAFYIPTRFFRMLLNKLARDFHNYPALGGLVQTLMSYVVGGDSSNWVGVLGLPHYNMNDMPAVSFRVAQHLAQIKHTGKFRMYDYGSKSANMEVYGSPEPLDLGESYKFIDVPVDLVAGRNDKVIRSSMVKKHYNVMRDAEVDVSFNEFEYAHLDFTFSHREELLRYVMSRLLLVKQTPVQQRQTSQKGMKLKKKKREGTVV
ncbi:AB-hydrolase lipase domain [Arabidopsis suecica]|uniref:AB-hydrolase lipase domain n=1 Tax=Arabidopsis suecica TaxID=45249 RepID=A0A8T2HM66_ARASU|nr:AB-hydrolase lipase domain [Arabidopsis suecica]